MRAKCFTTSTFARKLGFSSAHNKGFRAFLKNAERKGLLRIQHGGFRSDSMHHPYIVVLTKPLEYVKLAKDFAKTKMPELDEHISRTTRNTTRKVRRCLHSRWKLLEVLGKFGKADILRLKCIKCQTEARALRLPSGEIKNSLLVFSPIKQEWKAYRRKKLILV